MNGMINGTHWHGDTLNYMAWRLRRKANYKWIYRPTSGSYCIMGRIAARIRWIA